MLKINKTSRTIRNGISSVQGVEIRNRVSITLEYFNLRITKYGGRNSVTKYGDMEKSQRLLRWKSLKLIQQRMKNQLSSSLSITIRCFFSFWTILSPALKIVASSYSSPFCLRVFIKKMKGQAPSQVGLQCFHLSYRYFPVTRESVFISVAVFYLFFCLFLKSSMAPGHSRCLFQFFYIRHFQTFRITKFVF